MDRPGYRPEIFALGIRNAIGMAFRPETGQLWETENGPQGGDEINIIRPGANYGWPVVSYGRVYSGNPTGGLSGASGRATCSRDGSPAGNCPGSYSTRRTWRAVAKCCYPSSVNEFET